MPPLLTTHQVFFPCALYLGSGISFLYAHLLCVCLFCALYPIWYVHVTRVFPILLPRPQVCRGAPALTPEPGVALPSHIRHGAPARGLKQALFPVVAVLTHRCAPVLCRMHRVLKAEQNLVHALLPKRERRGFSSSHEGQTPLKPMSHPWAHGFVGEAWVLKEFRWNFFTPSVRRME